MKMERKGKSLALQHFKVYQTHTTDRWQFAGFRVHIQYISFGTQKRVPLVIEEDHLKRNVSL